MWNLGAMKNGENSSSNYTSTHLQYPWRLRDLYFLLQSCGPQDSFSFLLVRQSTCKNPSAKVVWGLLGDHNRAQNGLEGYYGGGNLNPGPPPSRIESQIDPRLIFQSGSWIKINLGPGLVQSGTQIGNQGSIWDQSRTQIGNQGSIWDPPDCLPD